MSTQDTSEVRAKAKAFDKKMAATAADDRASRRRAALQRVAKTGGADAAEARRMLAKMDAEAEKKAKADAAAAEPTSIEEAGGNARAFSKADMKRQVAQASGEGSKPGHNTLARDSMIAQLRAQGIEPVGG